MLHRTRSPRDASFARRATLALILTLAALAAGCGSPGGGEENVEMAAFRDVPDSAWTALAGKRIYFGHQSVGGNIMQGVSDLVAADPRLGLRVLDRLPADSAGVFLHGDVGQNGHPARKTDDFEHHLESGAEGRLDIAFHKYCFADIVDTTDVEAVFRHYRDTMRKLETEYPAVTFVHVTAPLVRVQSGPRALLKKLMGQAPGRYASNFKRQEFNERMRREYGGKEPLFDLAAVESTRPDGSRETISHGGRTAYALYPGYTDDGSHLNASGRRRAAEELLALLAGLPAGH